MKKIFILTGEASGDKLASTVIEKIQKQNNDVKFLSVGGSNLTSLGINSIFNIEQITYMGFTSVLLNIFKIKNKIDFTVKEIIKFNPDILFSVDSPDFTLRVAERVKKTNPNIIRLFNHPKICPSFIHALYGYKRRPGLKMPRRPAGILINNVQTLKG